MLDGLEWRPGEDAGEKCPEQSRIDALAWEMAELHRGMAALTERVERLEAEVLPREVDPDVGMP